MNNYIIAVSGSSGFIGKNLINWLKENNYHTIPLSREDFLKGSDWIAAKISSCNAVINLAGKPVITRWTGKARKEILESRISTTGIMVEVFSKMKKRPDIFINASAIGIYAQKFLHNEESGHYDKGFLAQIVKEWEKAAVDAGKWVKRIVILRMGIVLSFDGGAAAKVKSLFRFGMGGYLGNGRQKMSFIHIKDLFRMIEFILLTESVEGIVNCVAPSVTDNREYSYELARNFGWKHLIPVPGFLLRLRFGKAADILLHGQHVVPEKIVKAGFVFHFPDIKKALKSLSDESN